MELTQAAVHELLKYDPHTGRLTWRRRSRKWFKLSARDQVAWNSQFAGKPAFDAVSRDRYRRGRLFRHTYRTDNIIWLWMTGSWPESKNWGGLVHLNRDRSDNRWCNLFNPPHPSTLRRGFKPPVACAAQTDF